MLSLMKVLPMSKMHARSAVDNSQKSGPTSGYRRCRIFDQKPQRWTEWTTVDMCLRWYRLFIEMFPVSALHGWWLVKLIFLQLHSRINKPWTKSALEMNCSLSKYYTREPCTLWSSKTATRNDKHCLGLPFLLDVSVTFLLLATEVLVFNSVISYAWYNSYITLTQKVWQWDFLANLLSRRSPLLRMLSPMKVLPMSQMHACSAVDNSQKSGHYSGYRRCRRFDQKTTTMEWVDDGGHVFSRGSPG